MAINRIDSRTSQRGLATAYRVVGLASETWQSIQLPDFARVCEAQSTEAVVVREATDSTLPTDTPSTDGGLLVSDFRVQAGTTHLHFYSLSTGGDTLQLNFYAG